MRMSFLKNIIKESKNEFASIVDQGIEGSDIVTGKQIGRAHV